MKNSFRRLLKGMLLASTASMASTATANDLHASTGDVVEHDLLNSVIKQTSKQLQKYIIKFGNDGLYAIVGHRSHSSHSSHRSHRSSSGNYYGGSSSRSKSSSTKSYTPAKSETKTTPTTKTKQISEKESSTTQKAAKTQNSTSKTDQSQTTINNGNYIFSLGERTLQVGCIGTDVKVLATLLQKHGFIEASNIETNDSGYVIYNKAIAEGVKKFQKVAKLPVNGIADNATITALRNYGK